jgi:ubiquinone/menaquinone biosynthesis C-methylase UbiE
VSESIHISRFSAEYLRGAAQMPSIRNVRRFAYETLQLGPHARVLDIGCGPGTSTIEIASLTGDDATVMGVDNDLQLVSSANAEAAIQGLSHRVSHQVEDARALTFGTGVFDRIYCERVLQHLSPEDVGRAVDEAVRVTGSGGRICLVDTDWTTLSIDAEPLRTERVLVNLHQQRHRNPASGRQLRRLLLQAGIGDVAATPFVNRPTVERIRMLLQPAMSIAVERGILPQAEIDQFKVMLDAQAAAGRFQSTLVTWVVAGTKPG